MDYLRGLVTGLFLGALSMYVLDPRQGRRRRALPQRRVVQ